MTLYAPVFYTHGFGWEINFIQLADAYSMFMGSSIQHIIKSWPLRLCPGCTHGLQGLIRPRHAEDMLADVGQDKVVVDGRGLVEA